MMGHKNTQNLMRKGLTLLELVIALGIMTVVFTAVLPLLRAIDNSWDSKQGISQTVQNARVLMDHIDRHLVQAVRISAVSEPTETAGYIEFEDNNGNTLRYELANNYVRFGTVGNLSDLAGPVSSLSFTCYDGNDFDNYTTDVNSIRFVTVQATLTNPAPQGQDRTFTSSVYIRSAGSYQAASITKGTPLEYDNSQGTEAALAQIDASHYLCAYSGDKDDGWAVVLTVDTGNSTISRETPFEFDTVKGREPALVQIDASHYLCAYRGDKDDGWAVVLTIDTGNWTISKETPFEFDSSEGREPALALAQIDSTHYLCTYRGPGRDGWAVVLTVDTGNWTISKETPFEFDSSEGREPALAQIDSTHYLCTYRGSGRDGWAVALTVDTGNWVITKESPFEFDADQGQQPALAQIEAGRYLCTYAGPGDDGWAAILSVDTDSWDVTTESTYEYDTAQGTTPALQTIDDDNYLCAYTGQGTDGWAVILQPGVELRP